MLGAVILGTISGKILFSKYEDTSLVFNEGRSLYFLQEGVYSSKENLDKNTKDISPKIVIPKDNNYYVYVGITSSLDNALKIKKYYKDKGYTIYQKQIRVNNIEFINNVEQFDVLVESATDSDILKIEEVVLSNYDDLIAKN